MNTPDSPPDSPAESLPESLRYPRDEHDQPLPFLNDGPFIQDFVIDDIRARQEVGRRRYGTPGLQPHNGRDTLLDAYQEALDLACYLRTVMYERDGR